MVTFGALFTLHGSDKDTLHSYGPVYQCLFPTARRTVARVLEIGVENGASLRAWCDAFPNAEVDGWDVNRCDKEVSRATFSLLDATDFASAETIADGTYDLIIDDGSHWPCQQSATLGILFQKLAIGGIYVIEDIQVGVCGAEIVRNSGIPADAAWQEIDRRNVKNRTDDRLIILSRHDLPSGLDRL